MPAALRRSGMRLCGILLCLALASGCGSTTPAGPAADAEREPGPAAAWDRVPDAPLPARGSPLLAWTGREVLLIGGDDGPPCPPNASCVRGPEPRRDGAAYDPAARTWRALPDAPVGISGVPDHVIVGRELFVLTGHEDRAIVALDLDAERWRRVPAPFDLGWADLVADGDRVVLAWGSHEEGRQPDRVLGSDGSWTPLPADPLGPTFGRAITSTPAGLVLTGHELVASPGSDGPSIVLAALLDRRTGRWRRLPDSDLIGGSFHWTGTRLVDATPGGADGGEVGNYGRVVPYGGRLDPATGTWSHLPSPPAEHSGGWSLWAADGARIATAGWVYDDAAGTWTRVPRPRGAPESPGSSTWAGERLFAYGGETWTGTEGERSGSAWLSLPIGSWPAA